MLSSTRSRALGPTAGWKGRLVTQTDLATGLPFLSAAAQLLREEQLRCHYSSPFWVDITLLPALSLKLRRTSREARAIWLPGVFLRQSRESSSHSLLMENETSPHRSDNSGVVPLMNAVFVEETDLFLFLVAHPLSTEQHASLNRPSSAHSYRPTAAQWLPRSVNREAQTHFIHWRGAWEACAPGNEGHSWLLSGCQCIDAQLCVGRAPCVNGSRVPCLPTRDEAAAQSHNVAATPDYLRYLIKPPDNAGTGRPSIKADQVWLDESAVQHCQLECFKDAFWVPFHWMLDQHSCFREAVSGGLPFLGCKFLNSDHLVMDHHLSRLMDRV